MDQNRLSLLALHFISGVGDRTIRQLIAYCGSAAAVFRTPRGKLLNIPGIGATTATAIQTSKPFALAEQEATRAQRQGARLLFYTDHDYPRRLQHLGDAPTLLYIQGGVDLDAQKTVAIVGTRKATDYGRYCAEQLVAALVPHQPLVISGLAYGIDIFAHTHALKCNLSTVAILGSGLDVIYPAAHRDTARKMLTTGGLVTEQRFGAKPDAFNFPARNRIIAGLADAVVVVEAAETGGALITADIANSYNKDVFAFPGNIGRSNSAGCNTLIKQNKAALITSVEDLEYLMDWTVTPAARAQAPTLPDLSPDELAVVTALQKHDGQLHVDELSWHSGIAINKLAGVLLTLELKGLLRSLPGKVYRLTP